MVAKKRGNDDVSSYELINPPQRAESAQSLLLAYSARFKALYEEEVNSKLAQVFAQR